MNVIGHLENTDPFAELESSFVVSESADKTTGAVHRVLDNVSQIPLLNPRLGEIHTTQALLPKPLKALSFSQEPIDLFFAEVWKLRRRVQFINSKTNNVYATTCSPIVSKGIKCLKIKPLRTRTTSKPSLQPLSSLKPFYKEKAPLLVFHNGKYYKGRYQGYDTNTHSILLPTMRIIFPDQDLAFYAILPYSNPVKKALRLTCQFDEEGEPCFALPDDRPLEVTHTLSNIQSTAEEKKKRKGMKLSLPQASPSPTLTSSSIDHSATPQPSLPDSFFSEPAPEVGLLPPNEASPTEESDDSLDQGPALKRHHPLPPFVMVATGENDV